MPFAPALARPCRSIALVLAVASAPVAAFAAPAETADPVLRLLAEKGLIVEPAGAAVEPPAADPGLLRKVQQHASSMVVGAMNFIGVRYARGGTSAESGFDCSGFTRHVFEMSLGLVLPRSADEQAAAKGLVAVEREDLRPGDLVFFNTLRRTFSHVGIYIGENRFIHAPSSGKVVRTEDMSFAYWAKRFTGARRAGTAAVAAVEAEAVSASASASAFAVIGR
ncbi:MAG: C40 family peptidase [Caldimonas sp.]